MGSASRSAGNSIDGIFLSVIFLYFGTGAKLMQNFYFVNNQLDWLNVLAAPLLLISLRQSSKKLILFVDNCNLLNSSVSNIKITGSS